MRTSVCFCHLALSIRERDQSKDKKCLIQYSGRLAIRPSSCSKFPFCSLSLGAAEGLNRHVTLLDASQSCAPFECAFCVTCFFCILWLIRELWLILKSLSCLRLTTTTMTRRWGWNLQVRPPRSDRVSRNIERKMGEPITPTRYVIIFE